MKTITNRAHWIENNAEIFRDEFLVGVHPRTLN